MVVFLGSACGTEESLSVDGEHEATKGSGYQTLAECDNPGNNEDLKVIYRKAENSLRIIKAGVFQFDFATRDRCFSSREINSPSDLDITQGFADIDPTSSNKNKKHDRYVGMTYRTSVSGLYIRYFDGSKNNDESCEETDINWKLLKQLQESVPHSFNCDYF